MIAVWVAGMLVGMAVTALASRRAVASALLAGELAGISPTFVGVTVLAVGTDLPEIANSVAAALSGHGDIAVGDAAGSALTQVTLIFAILCVVAAPIRANQRTIAKIGLLTVAALVVDAAVVRDQVFSRANGLLLVGLWFVCVALVREPGGRGPRIERPDRRGSLPHVARALTWLAVVGVAATIVVRSFVEVSDVVGVPELLASAVLLALGTSLPELVVDWTALRQGAVALALGDLFGSSLVDATLAIGIGPAIKATVVSPAAAGACVVAACGVGLATLVAARSRSHGRQSAAALFGIYVVATAALVVLAG